MPSRPPVCSRRSRPAIAMSRRTSCSGSTSSTSPMRVYSGAGSLRRRCTWTADTKDSHNSYSRGGGSMKWLKTTYRKIADHVGKILSGIGAMLLSVDIAGYGSQMRDYAGQYLGPDAVKKIGLVIFALL